jgi:hypothetical protein
MESKRQSLNEIPYFNRKATQWWIRKREEEYFPEFEANHQPLIAYLTQFGILKKRKPEHIEPQVKGR